MDRETFDKKLNQLLSESQALIPAEALPDLPFMDGAPDVHDWYEFESKLWEKGEDIRQLILQAKKKPTKQQADKILEICMNINGKRGRESFVMLLGKKQYAHYAEKIASLLSDTYVDGHVIYTLYKMGAEGYSVQIEPFTKHNRTWIRNLAKRYLQKYQ